MVDDKKKKIIDLLLNCLHQDKSKADPKQFRNLNESEWNEFIRLSGEQQISAYLYHQMKIRDLLATMPETALNLLKASHRQNGIRNLRFFADLNRIVKAFQEKNIPVIGLKGAHLTQAVYENIAFREMSDFDLLVPVKDIEKAGEALISIGYLPIKPYIIENELITAKHLPPFFKANAVKIELHWNITPADTSYTINPDELWQDITPLSIAGLNFFGFSPEILLLHQCLHTSYTHQFQFGLRPSCDIEKIISHYEKDLDWEKIYNKAVQWHWEKGVYISLQLAKQLVGAAVPSAILHRLKSSDFKPAIWEAAWQQTFTNQQFSASMTGDAAKALGEKHLFSRLRNILSRIFLPKKLIAKTYAVPVNSWRLYFYYFVRLKDLIIRYRYVLGELKAGDPERMTLMQRKKLLANWLES